MKALIHVILYQPLFNLLILIAWLMPGHSIAAAIVTLTVIIRLILLPSSIKAAHHQARSLELQPKVNKIRSEIKDQKEQSQALMALYKEEGFSPFGSCLPLLIQIPIIWALFAVFRSGLSQNNYSALYSFIPRPETINTGFFGLDITRPNVWVLPIIAGILMFIQSYLSMLPQKSLVKQENDPTAMMTKQMIFIGPLITVFFGRSMPAALVIYWITTTIFGIGQQLYVNKQIRIYKEKSKGKESASLIKPLPKEEKKPKTKSDLMTTMMNKRLEKQEKKSGVNVTVRTKKK
jgi:YidC/Oxa1 family membrane protein insertase